MMRKKVLSKGEIQKALEETRKELDSTKEYLEETLGLENMIQKTLDETRKELVRVKEHLSEALDYQAKAEPFMDLLAQLQDNHPLKLFKRKSKFGSGSMYVTGITFTHNSFSGARPDGVRLDDKGRKAYSALIRLLEDLGAPEIVLGDNGNNTAAAQPEVKAEKRTPTNVGSRK
jgi:hypothetical protein